MSAPAGAKKPQDHKKPAADGALVVTVNGHDYQIARDALDDFELLDDLARLDDGEGTRLPAILRRLVGDDGYRAALDTIRDPETGRVSIEAGGDLLAALLKGGADPS